MRRRRCSKLNLPNIKIVLVDSQDSQGNAQAGVEAAQKLVNIDKVNVIIGDFYSSVTSAAATAVAIPNQVVMFTGGTSPALSKLNTGPVTLIWQPVAADDLQGRVLAQVIADALGKNAKINVAARNDAYGTNLSNAFKDAWIAGGGTIPEMVIYNHQQPTLDSEAQRVVQGNPDGWLFIDFCPTFEKLALPMTRTGKWDPAKSFGSDTLNDCAEQRLPELSRDARDAGQCVVGLVVPGVQGAVREERQAGRQVPVVHRRVVRLGVHRAPRGDRGAVLRSRQAQPEGRQRHQRSGRELHVRAARQGDPGVARGQEDSLPGRHRSDQLRAQRRITATNYDIWQHKADGTASVVKTITFKP